MQGDVTSRNARAPKLCVLVDNFRIIFTDRADCSGLQQEHGYNSNYQGTMDYGQWVAKQCSGNFHATSSCRADAIVHRKQAAPRSPCPEKDCETVPRQAACQAKLSSGAHYQWLDYTEHHHRSTSAPDDDMSQWDQLSPEPQNACPVIHLPLVKGPPPRDPP